MSDGMRIDETGRSEQRRCDREADRKKTTRSAEDFAAAMKGRTGFDIGKGERSAGGARPGAKEAESMGRRAMVEIMKVVDRNPARPGLPVISAVERREEKGRLSSAEEEVAAEKLNPKAGRNPGSKRTERPESTGAEQDRRRTPADAQGQAAAEAIAAPRPVISAPLLEAEGSPAAPEVGRLQELVEHAVLVRDGSGPAEFRIGFGAEALAGLRLRIASLGGNRIALRYATSHASSAPPPVRELDSLVGLMRARGLDVVELFRI